MNYSNSKPLLVALTLFVFLLIAVVLPARTEASRVSVYQYAQIEFPELEEISGDNRDGEAEEEKEEKEAEEKSRQTQEDSPVLRREFEQRLQNKQQKIQELQTFSDVLQDTIARQEKMIADYRDTIARLKGDTPVEDEVDTEPSPEPDTPVETEELDIPFDRPLDPNTASLEDLKRIPELSDRLAERIQWYRDVVRKFETRQDLRRVPGIGEELYEEIQHYFQSGDFN